MSTDLKVLQVIPRLGYGGAETGCFDIAHYLPENGCESFIVTSGGELIKFIFIFGGGWTQRVEFICH